MTHSFPTRRSCDLSISCFRCRPDGAGPEAIDRINARIQAQLVATGEIALSPTPLDGRYSLRVCIVNFRARRADIDWLVERVLAFGPEAGRTVWARNRGVLGQSVSCLVDLVRGR